MSYREECPSGIYSIRCIPTGRIYIGSALSIPDRWDNHRSELRRGIHHNVILQRAWAKYGESSFEFSIIEYVLIPDLLTAREQYWFDKLRPFGKRGFNMAPIADSPLGRKFSPEAKANMSRAALGKVMQPETREKIRTARLGKKASAESRARMSEAQRNRPPRKHKEHSPESRAKISASRLALDIKLSPEHIEKVRAANIGNQNARGYKHTPEAKRKMSETKRARKVRPSPDEL